MLVKAFLEHGARVLAYDPLAGRTRESRARSGRALILDNARDCLRDADVVLIATPDPEFRRSDCRRFQARRNAR